MSQGRIVFLTKKYFRTGVLFVMFVLIHGPMIHICPAYGQKDSSHQKAHHGHKHESQIPLGVMHSHAHPPGELMTTYQYMYMDMPRLYSGVKKQTVGEVHRDFMISPINMSMEMHMIGLMYGVNDELTAMLMVPYITKKMEHRRRSDDKQFSTYSQGIGDIRISGLYALKKHLSYPVYVNMGFSLPTGSLHHKDVTLSGSERLLPYPMQLGSGTVDFYPGVTYFDHKRNWSWGAQFLSTLRIGKNTKKYRLGHAYDMTSWVGYKWRDYLNVSLRLRGSLWGNVSGEDSELNSTMVPTADPEKRAGERVDILWGMNIIGPRGSGHQWLIEVGYPVYQRLEGPQLGVGLQGRIGWQMSW